MAAPRESREDRLKRYRIERRQRQRRRDARRRNARHKIARRSPRPSRTTIDQQEINRWRSNLILAIVDVELDQISVERRMIELKRLIVAYEQVLISSSV